MKRAPLLFKRRVAAQPAAGDVAQASWNPVPHVPPMPHVMPMTVISRTADNGLQAEQAVPLWAAGYEHAPISGVTGAAVPEPIPAGRP